MQLVELYVERCKRADEYSRAFVAIVAKQGNTWTREARSVMALASEHEVGLNEESLLLSDMHDLQALQSALEQHLLIVRRGKAGFLAVWLTQRKVCSIIPVRQ
jgi:hypothetical protein